MLCAVDVGNSKTDLVLVTEHGRIVHWARTGDIAPARIGPDGTAAELEAMLPPVVSGDGVIDATWVGAAGADFPDEEEALRVAVERRGVFGAVTVRNDIHALLGCVRTAGAAIAVVVGAGTNAAGVSGDVEVRFSALGTLSGDRAGGHTIGLEALMAACRAADGRGPDTSLHALVLDHFEAPDTDSLSRAFADGRLDVLRLVELGEVVMRAARGGDPEARRIIVGQAVEVAVCIATVARRLHRRPGDQPVALGGSVLRFGRDLMEPVIRDDLAPHVLDLRFPDFPPVVGAAATVLARHGCEYDVDELAADLARTPCVWV